MTSEKKDQKYEFRAHRSEPQRTNGSAPSRPWRTLDSYVLRLHQRTRSKLQVTAARMQQKQKKAKKAKVSLQSFWVSHIPSPHRQTRWTLVHPL